MKMMHIGLGPDGRQWLEAVRKRSDITSVGCVDTHPEALEPVRTSAPEVACFSDLGKALTECQADAAVVASPPVCRASHATEALEAGLAVLIVPPLADHMAAGVQVVEASRRTGRPVIMADVDRYGRGVQGLEALVREGKVGTVTHVSCTDRRGALGTG